MNLIIDRGNTLYKTAVIDGSDLKAAEAFKELSVSDLEKIFSKQRISKTILCSVGGKFEEDLIQYLKANTDCYSMDDDLTLPISLAYKTPDTLGKDRIASVVGALSCAKGRSVIVIDAGSCLCVDYADGNSVYRGGSISPGIGMKYRALHTFTANLPLLDLAKEEIVVCGAETQECIHSGVINGTLYEIEGFIDYYLQKDNTAEVVLTGGDAELIAKRLNRKVILDKHIVLKGLNVILNANAN
jgi:type III pantothenate kinase